MGQRSTWATRIGFILAAVGSAVGLGNIWQFPFKTAANGGAAFLVVYLGAVLLIGLPTILAEFVIGRRTKLNAVNAFEKLGHPNWKYVGALGVAIGFWIVAYYSVVGGWVLRYVLGSVNGAYFGDPAGYFGSISAGWDAIGFHGLFMLITVVIVAAGVKEGIERATKLMVPSIVVLMLGMAIWSVTLEGAGAGLEYFVLPDFGALQANFGDILPFAVGQAFFSLSLGMGIMITYASYIGEDQNLGTDAGSVVLLNTFVGVLAGFVVFPLLASQGLEYTSVEGGAGAIFVAVATAFGTLPLGKILGVVFFGVVAIAALSSAISLLEAFVSFVVDNSDYRREVIAPLTGLTLFVMGLPSAWNTAWLTWFDNLAYKVFLPLSVFLIVSFVAWIMGREAVDELTTGASNLRTIGPVWLWTLRLVVFFAVLGTIYVSVDGLIASQGYLPPPLQ